ncbi:MAG: ABC transporter substrate-binding protein [Roseiarcus sp.]|uniref:ABC transporter substrate-binding protein n=1 Tax=Roseiarcus sp. TaxID=1969460 RepID=UPI003C60C4C9
MLWRAIAFCLFVALVAAPSAYADESFVIGVMNDESGPYADLAGPGSVEMARMAIEDFGGKVLRKPIELLVADHQNKVDLGLQIARQWYDERGAKAIFDITNSGVALAIQDLAKARNRLVIFDSASSSDLTGKACSPNGVQWNADNWSNGVALMRLLIQQKLDSFFFITADYAFGASLEADARDAITKAGGTVVGGVRSPLNTADFSSYLIAAQDSKAKVIVFAITGADVSNAIKQANEFKLAPAQYLATPITYLSDVNALGLDVAHDLTFMQSWYWDLNDQTRAFAKRFYDRRQRMPNDNQVALYSSVRHYLEAVAKAGTDEAGAVTAAMQQAPIHDIFTDSGTVRADGRVLYDRYLMRVKPPADSKYPWDYLAVVAKIPAAEAFRPPGAGGCTLGTH